MNVKWFLGAKVAMRQTARYIRGQFGNRSSQEFLRKVMHTEQLLREHPHLGPLEPLLADMTKTYRSIVIQKVNKLVYYIEGDTIHIADFWDVRREPKKLAEQVKE